MALSAAQVKALKHKGERAFPEYTWWLYLSIIGVATLNNIAWKLWAWYRRSAAQRSSSSVQKGSISAGNLPEALITASRVVTLRWRFPAVSMNVLEVLMTIMYILVLFCLEFTSTNNLEIDLWANRTGHIVAIQFPLIVALSWKNSVIGLMTGISYEKLNLLHRVCSRVILVLVYVHLFGTFYNLGGAGGKQWFYANWTVCGPIAGFSLTLLVILSLGPIRKRFYEFFVKVHMILVTIILIAATIHVTLAPPGFGFYIWPALVLWAFDRLVRLGRWILLNNLVHPRKSSGQIDLVTDDTLLFTIRRRIPFGWRAGQHVYLSLPTLGRLQSHPFTIATIPSGDSKQDELIFIVRVRGGLTKKLKEHIVEFGPSETPMFLDGPYGAPPDITPFSTCVFMAGGSGISYTLPRLEELLTQVTSGGACARRIVFVWAIRSRAHLKWVGPRLAKMASAAPSGVTLEVHLHITSGGPAVQELRDSSEADLEKDASLDGEDTKSKAELDVLSDAVPIAQGRPDAFKILEAEVAKAAGPMSVDVAGPESLLNDTRKALTAHFAGPASVLKGGPAIQLNIEEFSM
ncbi:hypothetical protein EIP91_005484 [Steccherinum ochraceum]|uniref:ferric-chelate reductase (NADPH) n=1 Tax=Steccherinum ochraceum TaxID=92696 RepID=A0A4R0S2E8_9APHY|nr:hypothetical protein EIP91_005484 [Steccherinum ochraceum]